MSVWWLLLHVLGACVWVGGHLYLAIVVLPKAARHQDAQFLLDFEASFEKLGMSALIAQAISGLVMAHRWMPDWAQIFNHSVENPLRSISILLTVKLTWLLMTILTALSAQLWVLPRLKQNLHSAKLRRIFMGHILTITLLAVAFVVTGVLFRTGI